MQDIKTFDRIDKGISSVILTKFQTQAWYLAEEPVALAFFDDEVTVEEKKRMVQAFLDHPDRNEETSTMFRLFITPMEMKDVGKWGLDHFITPNTRKFFDRFKIHRFFKKGPISMA